MTYEEFKRQLGKVGVSAKEFACLLEVNPNSITNYSQYKKVPSHLVVIASLIAKMAENGLDFKNIISRANQASKKTSGQEV